jgi:preprotein translocase subunit SecG
MAELAVPDFILEDDAARRVLTKVVFVCAILLAGASVVLCALWSSRDSPGFIGIPDIAFETNLIAWHVVLLVCGFFVAQVMALTVTGMFPESRHTRLSGDAFWYHLFWMVFAASTKLAGIIAAKNYAQQTDTGPPREPSMHAVFGVATAVVYAINFVLLLVLGCVSADRYKLKWIRLIARIAAFLLTVVSIASGIMLYQGETGCFPRTAPLPLPAPDYHPAAHYPDMPVGCRVSNGLGVAVAASALCTVYFLALRYDSWQDQAGRRLFLAGMEASALANGKASAESAGSKELSGKVWSEQVAGLYQTAQRGGWEVKDSRRKAGDGQEVKEGEGGEGEGEGEGESKSAVLERGGVRVAESNGAGVLI